MSLYWAAWLLIGFGVPEGIALFTKHPENTLSDTVWRWFDVTPGKTIWQWSILHFVLLFFMVWLFGHFVLGVWKTLR